MKICLFIGPTLITDISVITICYTMTNTILSMYIGDEWQNTFSKISILFVLIIFKSKLFLSFFSSIDCSLFCGFCLMGMKGCVI